jgi:hypothetical protein
VYKIKLEKLHMKICKFKAADSLNYHLYARVITFPDVRILKNVTLSVIYRRGSYGGNRLAKAEVPDSNVNRDTVHHLRELFSWFSSGNCWSSTIIGSRQLPFQFITHRTIQCSQVV